MGFKEISGAREYRGWRDWSEGDFIVGLYKDTGEQDSDYGIQLWYDIEVTENNFGFENGKVLRLNGNGSVNSKFENIAVKSTVKVIFEGYDTLTKGKFKGKEFADVTVMVDESEEATPAKETSESETDYSGL